MITKILAILVKDGDEIDYAKEVIALLNLDELALEEIDMLSQENNDLEATEN